MFGCAMLERMWASFCMRSRRFCAASSASRSNRGEEHLTTLLLFLLLLFAASSAFRISSSISTSLSHAGRDCFSFLRSFSLISFGSGRFSTLQTNSCSRFTVMGVRLVAETGEMRVELLVSGEDFAGDILLLLLLLLLLLILFSTL